MSGYRCDLPAKAVAIANQMLVTAHDSRSIFCSCRRVTVKWMKAKIVVAPLRKMKGDGTPYTRPTEVEATIERLLGMSRQETLAVCALNDRRHADYVPSECVLHLLRRAGQDKDQVYLERLFLIFAKRVARAFPVPERLLPGSNAKGLSSSELAVREFAIDKLTEMLCLDRQGYDDRLDIYEATFDAALKTLRATARRSVGRQRNRLEPLSDDPEAAEPSSDVEDALLRHVPGSEEKIERRDYRRKLLAAIQLLPDEDRRLLMLLIRDIPIHSKDPTVTTVARLIRCGEQTVRNRRDRIYRDLRRALGLEPAR